MSSEPDCRGYARNEQSFEAQGQGSGRPSEQRVGTDTDEREATEMDAAHGLKSTHPTYTRTAKAHLQRYRLG